MTTSKDLVRKRLRACTCALLAASVLAGTACVLHDASWNAAALRPASDTPDHFLIGEKSGGGTHEPGGDLVCHSPLVDPRSGTKITLLRSSAGRGDYEVPAGKYGVEQKEVLRIECANGKALGIFKR